MISRLLSHYSNISEGLFQIIVDDICHTSGYESKIIVPHDTSRHTSEDLIRYISVQLSEYEVKESIRMGISDSIEAM